MAAVGEGALAVGLDPHLVARVRRHHVQRRDVQPELARLGELADAGAQRQEVLARYRGGQVGDVQRHVVHTRVVQAEDVLLVGGWQVRFRFRFGLRGGAAGAGSGGRGSVGGGGVAWVQAAARRGDEVGEGAACVGGELGEEGARLFLC